MGMSLKEIFIKFCSFGKGNIAKLMDGRTWVKCLKDSGVINIKDGISSTTADLTFAKIVNRGKRKIGFVQFKKGLQELANRSSVSYDDIEGKILAKGGPTARGTRADNVRLARKDQFVGVHTRGGPSTLDMNPTAQGLSSLLDRTDYDVRGGKLSKQQGGRRSTGRFGI